MSKKKAVAIVQAAHLAASCDFSRLASGFPGPSTTNRRCGTCCGANDTTSEMCAGSDEKGQLLDEAEVKRRCSKDVSCVGYASAKNSWSGYWIPVTDIASISPKPDSTDMDHTWETFIKVCRDCNATHSKLACERKYGCSWDGFHCDAAYIRLAFGDRGCPAGLEVVSYGECVLAVESLGLRLGAGQTFNFSHGNPRFCLFSHNYQELIFNSGTNNSANEDVAPICKKRADLSSRCSSCRSPMRDGPCVYTIGKCRGPDLTTLCNCDTRTPSQQSCVTVISAGQGNKTYLGQHGYVIAAGTVNSSIRVRFRDRSSQWFQARDVEGTVHESCDSTWVKLPYGVRGCPDGLEIDSEKQCISALLALNLIVAPSWTGSKPVAPSFCAVREFDASGREHMHWNTARNGLGRSYLAPVCKALSPPPPKSFVSSVALVVSIVCFLVLVGIVVVWRIRVFRRCRGQGLLEVDLDASPKAQIISCLAFAESQRFAIEELGIGAYLDSQFDRCFCDDCFMVREEPDVYWRGQPSYPYVPPQGWCRLGLKCDAEHPTTQDALKHWHVAFHGTRKDAVRRILEVRDLLKPGEALPDGQRLSVVEGHISTNDRCFYTSPTIEYAGRPVYARLEPFHDRAGSVQVAFMLRQRPSTYEKGRATTWWPGSRYFSDAEVEWSSDRRGCIVLTGLLVRLRHEPCFDPALFEAVMSYDLLQVSRLLALHRALVNPDSGRSALHMVAIAVGNNTGVNEHDALDVALMLLRAGCCPSLEDRNGQTALDILRLLDGHRQAPRLESLLASSTAAPAAPAAPAAGHARSGGPREVVQRNVPHG
eukprot:TRINITY_DN15540_c0_g1_i6.p1 TRINITY_DN15540_c0_g1~~TRINITY_DN15540_c0_g1_i6.p1  ORF type:complete len:820 (+),score=84.40 TRINITY_DN15540_c0_g1_i6:141-2600(+)